MVLLIKTFDDKGKDRHLQAKERAISLVIITSTRVHVTELSDMVRIALGILWHQTQ